MTGTKGTVIKQNYMIKLFNNNNLSIPAIRVGSVKSLTVKLVKPWILALTWTLRVPKDPFMLLGDRIIRL